VAGRWRCEATYRGRLRDVASTGKRVSWTATNISRIGNGKIAETTAEEDILGLMRQLGDVPEPTSAV
jgi:predicted ester cyclase